MESGFASLGGYKRKGASMRCRGLKKRWGCGNFEGYGEMGNS